jgi:uncharacterized protein
MKIWIDLAGPPQVLFFRPILREMERRGHHVTVTTRAYGQTNQLAEKLAIPYTNIGKHGGRSFYELMRQNYLRSFYLAQWARHQKFDLAASHNSYSQAVAARLLGIPFVTSMDYEFQPLNHLCFRLARRVIVPLPFPDDALRKFGAARKTVRYSGLKEQIYLADFEPHENFRQSEGLPQDRPLIVIRPPAPWTAYHRFENDIFDQMLASLANQADAYLLFLPRIASQVESVRHLEQIHVAEKVYDGPELLYHADVVISGGGTMNREAAVLGTPTYTIFRGKLGAVDQFLIDNGRMVRIITEEDIAKIQLTRKDSDNTFHRTPALVEQITTMYLEGVGGRQKG